MSAKGRWAKHSTRDPNASRYAERLALRAWPAIVAVRDAVAATRRLEPVSAITATLGRADERVIDNDAERAKAHINRIINEIDNAIKNDHGQYPAWTGSRLKKAKSYLECARGKLDSLGSKCEKGSDSRACNHGAIAWANWIFATRIHICPVYFGEPALDRAGTIVHEATHACGTLDGPRETPNGNFWVGWHDNAETYEWWIDNNTFCVPGYNCP